MTRFYAYDGTPIAEYAKERRLYLPIAAIPSRVKAAFLSAEDKSFYSHSGIDALSIVKAAWSNAVNLGSGQRMIGASTITQQLAKNFLLSSDRTLERKIKEAVLSIRIERSLSKDKILELYLNDIYLGLGAYGIAAGALTYFGKSVTELTVADAAYLAALPKGPNNYNPHRHPERAISRRNWVIGQMQRNGFVSAAEASNMECVTGTKVIVIGRSNDVARYKKLLDAGVSDYLVAPFDPMDFVAAVHRCFRAPVEEKLGRIVAFVGAKGGTGSSTLAHNVAYAMTASKDSNSPLL